jgi:hypothetical protein
MRAILRKIRILIIPSFQLISSQTLALVNTLRRAQAVADLAVPGHAELPRGGAQ